MATSDETDDRIGQGYRRRVRMKIRTATRQSRRAMRPVWDRVRFARQDLTAATPTLPRVAYLFIAPFFLLFSVFLAFPVFYTLYLSFSSTRVSAKDRCSGSISARCTSRFRRSHS